MAREHEGLVGDLSILIYFCLCFQKRFQLINELFFQSSRIIFLGKRYSTSKTILLNG